MNADLIAKIQKLRALAQSANVNEAANAAAAAEKLIAEHQLTEADLESAAEVKEHAEQHQEPLAVEGTRAATWQLALSYGLARFYGVALVREYSMVNVERSTFPYKGYESRVVQRAIGRKSDVEILRYQYAFLHAEIERLAQRFLDENRFERGEARTAGVNFRVGAVAGVLGSMREARKTTTDAHCVATGNTTAALVLVGHREEAEALKKKLHPDLYKADGTPKYGRSGSGFRTNAAAYSAGREAGRGIHQGGKLDSAKPSRQLGGKP